MLTPGAPRGRQMASKARRAQAQVRSLPRQPWEWPTAVSGRRVGAVVLLLVIAAAMAEAGRWLAAPGTLPIKRIRVEGTFRHVSAQTLRELVATSVHGGFFSVDVAGVKRAVEALPWVARAGVRRVWPDTLALDVQEQHALARWGDGGLINLHGELFTPAVDSYPAGLPLLQGPPQMNAQLAARYTAMQQELIPLGLRIAELTLDARRAWRVRLDNGLELMLGRSDSAARLQRFVAVYPKVLAARATDIARVDLRYTNGFAVAWRHGTDAHQG